MSFGVGVDTNGGDDRIRGIAPAYTVDGNFSGGYRGSINTSSGAQFRMPCRIANFTPGVGGHAVLRGEVYISSAAAWQQAGPSVMRISASGAPTSTFADGEVSLEVSGLQQVYVRVMQGGTVYTSTAADFGSTALADDTRYVFEVKAVIVSDTEITVYVRMNGTLIGSKAFTTASGWATTTWTGAQYGGAFNAQLTGIFWYGGLQMCISTGGAPNDWFSDLTSFKGEMILPNGNVQGKQGWFLSGTGAAGSYTEWDDAVGAFSAADYNNTGTGAGAETQASNFAATSGTLLSTDTVVGVTLVGAHKNSVAWVTSMQMVSDDGTEDAQTTLPSSGTDVSMFTFLQGGSGAWSKSAVDAANFKLRSAADATNRQCECLFAFVWSYTAPAITRRIFLC